MLRVWVWSVNHSPANTSHRIQTNRNSGNHALQMERLLIQSEKRLHIQSAPLKGLHTYNFIVSKRKRTFFFHQVVLRLYRLNRLFRGTGAFGSSNHVHACLSFICYFYFVFKNWHGFFQLLHLICLCLLHLNNLLCLYQNIPDSRPALLQF